MDKLVIVFLLTFYFSCALAAVKIIDLKVPEALESGSEQNVILDCDFEMIDDDESSLTIKWFYEGDVNQVYQWLPGRQPQAIGKLRDRLDLEYQASTDKNKMYRALKIKELSPTLTGSYTCQVSTVNDEATATKKMIIYRKEDDADFTLDEETSTLTCSGSGLFPKPDIKLFKSGGNKTLPLIVDYSTDETDEGFYNITASGTYIKEELNNPTIFDCDISIPGTDYVIKRSITYYPVNITSLDTEGGEPTTPETVVEHVNIDNPTIATEFQPPDNFGVSCCPNRFLLATIVLLFLLFNVK